MVEVPVGFKWFVPGLIDGSFGFGGEESAGASFLRTRRLDLDHRQGRASSLPCWPPRSWRRPGQTPSEHYADLVAEHGDPAYARVDAPADREQKAKLGALSPDDVTATELAGEEITAKLTEAPGNGAKIGGLKVTTESRLVRRPAVGHRGRLQDLRRVVPGPRAPRPGAGRGAGGRSAPRSAAESVHPGPAAEHPEHVQVFVEHDEVGAEAGAQLPDPLQAEHRRRARRWRRGRRPRAAARPRGRRTCTAAAMVSVDPAITPEPASRADPVAHLDGHRPERVVAVVGTGRRHRVRDRARRCRLAVGGQPQHRRMQVHAVGDQLDEGVRSARAARRPGRARGGAAPRIALNRWVPTVAPASSAARASSYVASVWPIAATTPAAVSRRIASSPPGSSGARVTIRRCPRGRSSSRVDVAGSGSVSSAGSCAPACAAASQGPSRWMPASTPVGDQRSELAQRRGSSASTRVGDQAGHDRRGAVGQVGRDHGAPRRRTPVVERRAAAAVHVRVDEPGHERGRRKVDIGRSRRRPL